MGTNWVLNFFFFFFVSFLGRWEWGRGGGGEMGEEREGWGGDELGFEFFFFFVSFLGRWE